MALAMILMAGWSRESVEPGAKPFPSHDLGGSQPQGPQRGWVQPAQCGLVCRPCIPSTHWSMSPLPSKPQLLQNFPQKARTHPPDALGPRVSKAGPSPELLLWSAPNLGYSTEWGGTLGRCRGPFLPAPPPPRHRPRLERCASTAPPRHRPRLERCVTASRGGARTPPSVGQGRAGSSGAHRRVPRLARSEPPSALLRRVGGWGPSQLPPSGRTSFPGACLASKFTLFRFELAHW